MGVRGSSTMTDSREEPMSPRTLNSNSHCITFRTVVMEERSKEEHEAKLNSKKNGQTSTYKFITTVFAVFLAWQLSNLFINLVGYMWCDDCLVGDRAKEDSSKAIKIYIRVIWFFLLYLSSPVLLHLSKSIITVKSNMDKPKAMSLWDDTKGLMKEALPTIMGWAFKDIV